MNSDSESDEMCMPSDFLEEAKLITINEKSRKQYTTVYKNFMDWRAHNNVEAVNENVLLTYFGELSEKYKSSSVWVHYSMLKSTLNTNDGINIENYSKLREFLKRKSEGYQTKKAKTFTSHEINKFINEAPDNIYLATKVALIMGIMGACHANELHAMNIEDLQDLNSAYLVTVPNIKTKKVRKFIITSPFYQICKKYADLRPPENTPTSFFLNYQNGKCTVKNIGTNKFGGMGKEIAKFLKLPNPENYNGHSFRKSSDNLIIDEGGDLTAMKRLGAWKSMTEEFRVGVESSKEEFTVDPLKEEVTDDPLNEEFTDDPLKEQCIEDSMKQNTSSFAQRTITTNENINIDINSTPSIHIANCSNISINFISNKSDEYK